MGTIKFLFRCFIACIDAWAGASNDRTTIEWAIGLACLAVIEVLFFIPFVIIGKKTNIKLVPHILISIGIAITCVALICLIIVMVESLI